MRTIKMLGYVLLVVAYFAAIPVTYLTTKDGDMAAVMSFVGIIPLLICAMGIDMID